MSLTLAPVVISGSTVGALGGQLNLQNAPAKVIAVDMYNASPVDLLVRGLPGGDFWLKVNEGRVIYTPGPFATVQFMLGQVPSLVNAPSSAVLVTYYIAGDAPPAPGTYYIGRLNSLGNASLPLGTSSQIQGANQHHAVIEVDSTTAGGGPQLAPEDGASLVLALAFRAPNGGRVEFLYGNPTSNEAIFPQDVRFNGQVSFVFGSSLLAPATVNGYAVTGQSFPLTVASALEITVTAKTTQVIRSYVVPSDGNHHLRAGGFVQLANAVSGNAITFGVSYSDRTGTGRTAVFTLNGGAGANVFANGANSAVNGAWAAEALHLVAQAGSTVQIVYQDPTNTPNDVVSATIELLH